MHFDSENMIAFPFFSPSSSFAFEYAESVSEKVITTF